VTEATDSNTPAHAIKALYRALRLPNVWVVKSYVAQDLANLRRAFPLDNEFAGAVLAVAKELLFALRAPAVHGTPITYALDGWRRSRFASGRSPVSDLRLIFRKRAYDSGIEVLAFGHREIPDTVYHTAAQRNTGPRPKN